jgi:hypothetical protein
MPELYSIEKALESTGFNRARLKLLARFLVALIACRSVCLTKVANALPGKAQSASHYKRLQRFLRGFDLDAITLARLTLCWLQAGLGVQPPYVLALDRTHWKFGKTEINVLKVALVYKGVAFPLLWTLLGKAGNSKTQERIALLSRYLDAFGKDSIAYLLADREFGGCAFLSWLQEAGISFVIRLRGNTVIENVRRERRTARGLFWHRKTGHEHHLGRRAVFGGKYPLSLVVSGMRLPEGEFLIVVSDRESPCGNLLTEYAKRWGIETLFGSLKSRGFDLEATHLQAGERLSRLLSVLSLAFCWAYLCGAWLFEQKPWKVKKHGRLPVSLFRRGLDFLQRLVLPICGRRDREQFQNAISFLSCT